MTFNERLNKFLHRQTRAVQVPETIVWRGRVFVSCAENENVEKLRGLPVLEWSKELIAYSPDSGTHRVIGACVDIDPPGGSR